MLWPDGKPHIPFDTATSLREKVNAAILQVTFSGKSNELLTLPLTFNECVLVDAAFHVESYNEARLLLVQVFSCMWEHQSGLPLKTELMAHDHEDSFDANKLLEFLHRQDERTEE
jgi:hypothetical protein